QKELLAQAKPKAEPDDAPSENGADLTAMFDQINNLPKDDPLRVESDGSAKAADTASVSNTMTAQQSAPPPSKPSRLMSLLPAKVVAAFKDSEGINAGPPAAATAEVHAPDVSPEALKRANGTVLVDAGRRVAVPSFGGVGLRNVVETAAGLGLRVEPVGS